MLGAAGIVPYTYINGEIVFLLGLERSNGQWSGFIGGQEPGENIIDTANREFNEETCMVFNKIFDLSSIVPDIDKSASGKLVYIWFIEFPYNNDIPELFKINQTIYKKKQYREKSKLRWFTLNEIKGKFKIFYRLKNMILSKFNLL
jgi:8-oxo-dGTP pyrophosphatase MutT (NUDIX family)